MVKKKKNVSVNTIDKYLKQLQYRSAIKKPEKPKICQPKVVIERIRAKPLEELIDVSEREKNPSKTLHVRVPFVKLKQAPDVSHVNSTSNPLSKKNTTKLKVKKPKKNVSKKTVKKSKSVACGSIKSAVKIKTTQPINKALDNDQKMETSSNSSKIILKKKTKAAKINEKKSKIKTVYVKIKEKLMQIKALPLCLVVTTKKKSAVKPEQSSGPKNVGKRNNSKALRELSSALKKKRKRGTDVEEKNDSCSITETGTKRRINQVDLENLNVASAYDQPTSSKRLKVSTASRKMENHNETFEHEECSPSSSKPCLCEPVNFDVDDFARLNAETGESLIPAKYRPCVEELKSLTPETIDKFVKDNQLYYIDFKKTEPQHKMNVHGKKKRSDELRDVFKCNPFDSAQQLAMYLALREIFNIPSRSFLECRYFFTLLMPELCCQLFAKIFQIKTSSAPRLIKKLYPQPVCPV